MPKNFPKNCIPRLFLYHSLKLTVNSVNYFLLFIAEDCLLVFYFLISLYLCNILIYNTYNSTYIMVRSTANHLGIVREIPSVWRVVTLCRCL